MPRNPAILDTSPEENVARRLAQLEQGGKIRQKPHYSYVRGEYIVNETILAEKIKAGTITATQIKAGTITTGLLAAESITTELLKANAITSAKIAANTIEAADIKAATITATELAANSVTSEKIVAGTIEASDIKSATITTTQIAAGTIKAANIEAATITTTQIAAGTIKAANIESGTITATQIAAATITATQLAANSVEAGQIKAEAVIATKIAANAVTSAKILAENVTTAALASGAVTAAKITVAELSAITANLGTITAGTVTGATLRTAASGKRVVLNSEGLQAFNASEEAVLQFLISTGNLKIKGAIEAGSTVPATTVTGQLTNAQLEAIAAAKITGTITEVQIGENAITAPKIAAGAVETSELAANSVVSAKIAAGEVKATNIATDAIESKHILAGTIEAGDIKSDTITATQIAADAIGVSELAANSVAAENIIAGTITATQLNATAIDAMTITGATFRTSSANPKVQMDSTGLFMTNAAAAELFKLDTEGMRFAVSTSETIEAKRKIRFMEGANEAASFSAYRVVGLRSAYVSANAESKILSSQIILEATRPEGETNYLIMKNSGASNAENKLIAVTKGVLATVINGEGQSSFLQLTGALAGRKISFGETTIEWPGGNNASNAKNVAHGLGVIPISVTANIKLGSAAWCEVEVGNPNFAVRAVNPFGAPAGGTKAIVYWTAIG